MYQKKIPEDLDCGLRVAFKVFGGKWKMCIMDAINRGIRRPAEIQKEIRSAPLRVIEVQLAELLFDGVIRKCMEEAYPKRSEYELTEMGESILPVLTVINQWGTNNAVEVRARYEELVL